ncbi:hypothetical protein B0I35DRAFT_487662 [Stachybotrys elegans]|uniref:FAD-binding PCMH-type domain-containing protein n=1 Tax=Stachybotrys elegans TaxID=80388 RepID=A0A8K0T997_9HYPO|nr:hypothetical protein B0I35DRAFT_487662 [Stachybotrys elegans]
MGAKSLITPILVLSLLPSFGQTSCTRCKAYPGTTSWPTVETWGQLNDTVAGRLMRPVPPGSVCHAEQPFYDEEQCIKVAQQWSVYEFHVQDPISVMWDVYSNNTCLPDPRVPCSGDGYPSYVINATRPEHVKAGVDFARENNIRLIVKSTGHDFLGRSIAPGSLSIWVHHLNKIEHHPNKFVLAGSGKIIPVDAVTVGGGAQMYDIYTATASRNRTIVGGGGKSVGISGYITGGGHSVLAPRYGLAADNVLQMEIVIPNGDIITVNEDQNSDLFWALRGGGGSTFGVITSITLQTHPSPSILSVSWAAITSSEASFALDFVTYLMSQLPYLSDSGFSGYNRVSKNTPSPVNIPGGPENITGIYGNLILQDVHDVNAVESILRPINETIHQRWGLAAFMFQQATQYDSFLDWFEDHYDRGSAGGQGYMGSRLFDKHSLTDDTASLKNALSPILDKHGGFNPFLVIGKGVQEAIPRGGSNAANPALRTSYIHSLFVQAFPPFNPTAEAEIIESFHESLQILKDITPSGGTYLNEAFPYEREWQQAFWGRNYKRLSQIKRAVDPDDVFWCLPCIAYDRWEETSNGRLCRAEHKVREICD